jgi:hypothetical protein
MKIFVVRVDRDGGSVILPHASLAGAQSEVLAYVAMCWQHMVNDPTVYADLPPMPEDPEQAVTEYFTYWAGPHETYSIEECEVGA